MFGEKNGVFLVNQCCDQILAKYSGSLSKKRQYFRQFFVNFFKNHNIGPRLCNFCQLGGCFLVWLFYEIVRRSPNFWATFYRCKKLLINKYIQRWVEVHFGRFFHKLVWPPCLFPSACNCIPDKLMTCVALKFDFCNSEIGPVVAFTVVSPPPPPPKKKKFENLSS
jgi:hypothetical protein